MYKLLYPSIRVRTAPPVLVMVRTIGLVLVLVLVWTYCSAYADLCDSRPESIMIVLLLLVTYTGIRHRAVNSYDTSSARHAYTCILKENDIMPLGNSHCIILRQSCDGFHIDSENISRVSRHNKCS